MSTRSGNSQFFSMSSSLLPQGISTSMTPRPPIAHIAILLITLFALLPSWVFSAEPAGSKTSAITIATLTRTTPVEFEKEVLPLF